MGEAFKPGVRAKAFLIFRINAGLKGRPSMRSVSLG